jgi:hypothetical protein
MAIITDPDNLNQATEITINTGLRTFTLNVAGNLSNDGVTLQALYSFFKEEWKSDNTLIPHPFPMVSITPEQFEFVDGWAPADDTTRKLIRLGGWREIDENNVLQQEHAGIVTLGTFEDALNDLAYYQVGNDPTDIVSGSRNFAFAGPVNEAIRIYNNVTNALTSSGFAISSNNTISRSLGSWISDGYVVGGQAIIANAEDTGNNGTWLINSMSNGLLVVSGSGLTNNAADTTMTVAASYRNRLKVFLRVRDGDTNGKTFAQSDLTGIGVTTLQNQVYRFPLSNTADLKISTSDATISGSSPYTAITVRYFSQSFAQDVDTDGVTRQFGIVIDAGTYSGIDGAVSSGGSVLNTVAGNIPSTIYSSGTLTIHESPASGTYSIIGSTPTSVTIASTFPSTQANLSFTLQRTTPVTSTAEEIYEKVQYLLRQSADIDSTPAIVTGRTADNLLTFVGDTLVAGRSIPNNPNNGGRGVCIQGFSSNDTNRLIFTDNSGVERTFPFVAAGTITFNPNLVDDTDGEYWMFFQYTRRTTVANLQITGSANASGTLNSATAAIPVLSNNDYIRLTGFANTLNNGIFRVNDASPTTSQVDIVKVNGENFVTQGPSSVTVDQNPFESPQAIIVRNAAGNQISGSIGASTVNFDFDYDGNVQGGRTAGTDAAITIVAIGLETAQYVTANGTISRAVGQSYSVVSSLERNYSNP